MYDTRMSVVELSRGSTWNPRPAQPPYLVAEHGNPWPAGAAASVVFRDTTGGELLTVAGETTKDAITFLAPADDVDPIPAGCNFEIFVTTDDGPVKVRYGKVIRREATFANPPASQVSNQALLFTDTFPTLGLRTNWKRVAGRTRVHNNQALSLPNSVGPDFDALFSASAIRWDTPLAGNSARVHITVIDPSPIVVKAKTTIILCADQRLTTGLAAQFESSSGTNSLRLGTISSPTSFTDRATPVTHNVVNGDDYTIVYDELTDKLHIYQGEDTTPLISWTDGLGVVPHGPGYTYLAMAFQASLTPFGPGVQVTGWQAKDGT
ncbi:hypothetical protein A5722_05180 [Mycobacterium vulneris]|nr:hypothetical protein A5721_28945 [Mycolicibacterium vulneris]OCB59148.1 hypothetical protein A5722_05180 [Mycolicibacterium vulneris]OCB61510.1 hypothetical protein A5729_03855 [Mycolicibacterium vulneris]